MSHDMGTPEGRLAAAQSLTPEKYDEAMRRFREKSIICTVNGHDIRLIEGGRFGPLYAVGDTDKAFTTMEDARLCANETGHVF